MTYISVGLTPAARDALRNLTLEQVVPRRRPTMSQVLLAMEKVARAHRAEFRAALEDEALRTETPE